ncbi:acyltransferase [Sphingomonas sp. Y38-1Y]|uniref:acyltransferase family protein n=1 Tax=Sphingomonas sp. Y38-1Y TaxID=3078265 RepID=UPI0028EF2F31|nr:acyltransferase [Sphingomonas sp. Y38-1Y]
MKSYVPELDGVRAIAVISVMIFHLGIFPIGWMGVPLFFVLSGYLITSILMGERSSEIWHYIAKFFWRRSVRIFPLYYAYLIVNLVLTTIAGLSIAGYGYFLFYFGNYRIGAVAPNVPGGVIGHLWSVAVEEQFYLIWPWLVYYVKKPAYLAAASIILAPLVREAIYDATNNPYMTIVSLPSCIDMLGAGAIVALVRRRAVLGAMLVAGGAIVGYCFWKVPIADFAHTEKWVPQAHFMYTGLGLLAAPFIACAGRIRVLAVPPLRYVGRISYGLYMWHLIVFAIVHRMKLPVAVEATASIAASFLVASLSWHFFEKRFLALKDRMFADRPRGETTQADA